MTDFALAKLPRIRSYKTILHYNPNIHGVEFQNLPRSVTDEEFQTRLQRGAETIFRRIEEIKAEKAENGINWTPPDYHFVRCELDAIGLKCENPSSCEGILDVHGSR